MPRSLLPSLLAGQYGPLDHYGSVTLLFSFSGIGGSVRACKLTIDPFLLPSVHYADSNSACGIVAAVLLFVYVSATHSLRVLEAQQARREEQDLPYLWPSLVSSAPFANFSSLQSRIRSLPLDGSEVHGYMPLKSPTSTSEVKLLLFLLCQTGSSTCVSIIPFRLLSRCLYS